MFYYTVYKTKLGDIYLISDGEFLTGLYFEKQKYLKKDILKGILKDDLLIFAKVKSWLNKYFSGEVVDVDNIPIKLEVSSFRKDVYDILLNIPYGKVKTYKEIALEVALKRGVKTMSSQAVGGAIGHNPISIIIPCHRVVGSNNKLVGYASGLEKKRWLLENEGVDIKIFDNNK